MRLFVCLLVGLLFAPNALAQLETPVFRDADSTSPIVAVLHAQGAQINAGVDIDLDDKWLSAFAYAHSHLRHGAAGVGGGLVLRPSTSDWFLSESRLHGGPVFGLAPTDAALALRMSQVFGVKAWAFSFYAGPKLDLATSFTSGDARLRTLLLLGLGLNAKREGVQTLGFHVNAEAGNTYAARGSALHATLGLTITFYEGLLSF